MKIAIVGTGYVGLVTGACLADTGASVTCVDTDHLKLAGLRAGVTPFFEPGLDSVVARNVEKKRLSFSSSLAQSLDQAEIVFIAVGTPPGDDGSADLRQVLGVAKEIGDFLREQPDDSYLVVVTKSTVPVGTAALVRQAIEAQLGDRRPAFDVASNPEFLKEGAAVEDFAKPDRIVVGVESNRAKTVLERLYRPFVLNSHPVFFMDIQSAEITKYAANAMLALRISFMNSIAELCDAVGADVALVRQGIGSDKRIGPSFLYPGPGYGGSCFPKDVRALASTVSAHNISPGLLNEVELINERQKHLLTIKLRELLGNLQGQRIAVWGLAFKPNTDDIREAPAIALLEDLLREGAEVHLYDPVAKLPTEFRDSVRVFGSAIDACEGADALCLVTEWSEFRNVDPEAIKMRGKHIVDGRNVLDAESFAQCGFTVARIGRPTARPSSSAVQR
jgi:UDPglucose 6-dehydrogenase